MAAAGGALAPASSPPCSSQFSLTPASHPLKTPAPRTRPSRTPATASTSPVEEVIAELRAGRLVIVTDAEIYGRYKVQRPRRLKSMVPDHVWRLVAPYGLAPRPDETKETKT